MGVTAGACGATYGAGWRGVGGESVLAEHHQRGQVEGGPSGRVLCSEKGKRVQHDVEISLKGVFPGGKGGMHARSREKRKKGWGGKRERGKGCHPTVKKKMNGGAIFGHPRVVSQIPGLSSSELEKEIGGSLRTIGTTKPKRLSMRGLPGP